VNLLERVFESMFHWYRLVGGASDGARALERDGVLAALVPAAPERSVVNAVVYRSADGLEAAYDEVASAYDEIGAKWTVWVPPGDDAAAALLESHGHELDARPWAMARALDGVERPPAEALSHWTAEGSLTHVSEINDRSYTFDTDSFSRALKRLPDGAAHVYVLSDGGAPVGCLLILDHEGNSEIQVVAVVPEARGRGITTKLLGHGLADAAERANETATLIATPLGYPVYERAGFEPLERVSMWERRPTASSG
jgi:ribosomal protein S18 acetylase RimI-like enzyme